MRGDVEGVLVISTNQHAFALDSDQRRELRPVGPAHNGLSQNGWFPGQSLR
jgi:hypothetical protein